MPYTQSSGPRIFYDTQNAMGDDPIVLLEGMGAQLIGWRQGFVDLLEAEGLSVIRVDSRDVGLSDRLGKWHQHDALYSLDDMANDIFRVLDALELPSAHIVGQSMGGIVAQTMAIARPGRVRSLALIYTAPAFDEALLQPDFAKQLAKGLPKLPFRIPRFFMTRMAMASVRQCASQAFPLDEAWARELIDLSYDRGFSLDGVARQMAVVKRGFDHRAKLGGITVPTTIIHGRADALIKPDAAFELAAAIPDAGLHIYPGMGHAVAEALWPELVDIIAANARRAPSPGLPT